jgi:hypothetical protein
MIARHCQWRFAKTPLIIASYIFFTFQLFFLKKMKDVSESDIFPTGARANLANLSLKKWKISLPMTSLHKRISKTDAFTQIHW